MWVISLNPKKNESGKSSKYVEASISEFGEMNGLVKGQTIITKVRTVVYNGVINLDATM